MRKEVLAKIAANKLTPQEGYDILYGTKSRKGRFVRMRINIAGHPFLNFFLRMFFLLPVPIGLGKLFLRFMDEDKYKEFMRMILDSTIPTGKVKIRMESKEIKVKLKICIF
ncbi:MAG: hypothetical protein WBL47_06580 [Bacilli bacterium]|jgi:hypothetical protein|nr:hypothetical protein [Acholeplasmataceae bacterium]HOA78715.1 hypothetical protein [Bacilli bacterium]HPZ27410.1 hypothetical protein [Bacilli bacterium]HQC89728.1 hypothetical protein [Bacilli bacterium]